jgi:hypothetical protein
MRVIVAASVARGSARTRPASGITRARARARAATRWATTSVWAFRRSSGERRGPI